MAHSARSSAQVALSGFAREAKRWTVRCLVVALAGTVLASCADDSSDRRFANEPIPTEDLVAQPSTAPTTVSNREPTAVATPLTTDQLLMSAGVAANLFWEKNGTLFTVAVAGGEPSEVVDLSAVRALAWTASPTGDRVALLVATDSAIVARIIGLDGATVSEAAVATLASGSPVPTGEGHYEVAWSNAGDRLLVALATGGILDVAGDGSVRTILSPAQARSPRSVAWSPSGKAIAYVDAGDTGSGTGLYVASVESLPVDPVSLIRPIPGGSREIDDIAWAAGSTGIVYSLRAADDAVTLGGDLFAVSAAGGSPRLIASAAATAQVGTIGVFAVSADGRAVVYAVQAPSDSGVSNQGLVVRQIDGAASVQITGTSGPLVSEVAWTVAGPAWVGHPDGDEADPIVVAFAKSDGSISTIHEVAPPATPVASPVASPVADRATPES